MIVTPTEIETFRAALHATPGAIALFETLADCEGDLEDAAITVALQVGQEPDQSDGWVQSLAKRWRAVICQATIREAIEQQDVAAIVAHLVEHTTLPVVLAIVVAIVVIKTGGDTFCAAFW